MAAPRLGFRRGWSGALDDPADVQWFADAVLALYNKIARDLGRGKPQPIFGVDERNGDVLWEFWTDGFAEAVELRTDRWAAKRVGEDADAAEALATIATLIAFARNESEFDSVQINALQDQAPSDLVDAVVRLHAARLRNSGVLFTPSSDVRPPKAGRNEPCPCGPGKKFKRCCGLR